MSDSHPDATGHADVAGVSFPPIATASVPAETLLSIKSKRVTPNSASTGAAPSQSYMLGPQPPVFAQPHPSFPPAPMPLMATQPMSFSAQYAALSNQMLLQQNGSIAQPMFTMPPIVSSVAASPPITGRNSGRTSNVASPRNVAAANGGGKAGRAGKAQAAAGKAAPPLKRAKTKDALLLEQLAATDEIGRQRTARVEALKRASEESELLARQQFALIAQRKKAALEKAKQAREQAEAERLAKEAAEQEQEKQERKKKAEEVKARQAARQQQEEARKALDAQSSAEAESRKQKEFEEKRRAKQAELLAREKERSRRKTEEQELKERQAKDAAMKQQQLEDTAREVSSREQKLTVLERSKTQSIADAEAKLAALQQSIAAAAKNREELVADTESKRRSAEQASSEDKVKQRQKEERLRFEMEAKVKRKMEWKERRAQTAEQVKEGKTAAAATAAAAGGSTFLTSLSDENASPPLSKPAPSSTARSRAKAAVEAREREESEAKRAAIASGRKVGAAREGAGAGGMVTSPRRSTTTRTTASTARVRQLRRSVVPLRRGAAAGSTATAAAAAWTPAMAREMAATWSFLFTNYGAFLPAERVAPCISALVSSRAHPRDAVDFTHGELHEMKIENWRTRKDILDTTRAYLKALQSVYVQQGAKALYDDRGNVLNAAAIRNIMDEAISRGEANTTSAVQATPSNGMGLTFSSPSPIPFDPLSTSFRSDTASHNRPASSLTGGPFSSPAPSSSSSSAYSGSFFDASGTPIDLAEIAAGYLKQQMEAAKAAAKRKAEEEEKRGKEEKEREEQRRREEKEKAEMTKEELDAPISGEQITMQQKLNALDALHATPSSHRGAAAGLQVDGDEENVTLISFGGSSATPLTGHSLSSPRNHTSSHVSSTAAAEPAPYVPQVKAYTLALNRPPAAAAAATSPAPAPAPSATATAIAHGQASSFSNSPPMQPSPPQGAKPKLSYAQMIAQRHAKKTEQSSNIPTAAGVESNHTSPAMPVHSIAAAPVASAPAVAPVDDDVILLPLPKQPSRPSGIPTYSPPAPAAVPLVAPAVVDSPAALVQVLNVRAATPPQPGRTYKLFGKKPAVAAQQ